MNVEPNYTIPSETTFSRNIISEMNNNVKGHYIESYFYRNIYRFGIKLSICGLLEITTHISLSSHYADESMNILRNTFNLSYFPENHTEEASDI